ncbi:MAG: DUF885 domain-containing protein [Acidobacteria bacterium]|nr:DUF885 domain-containing protein [Acidobacteriota bacterium]
MTVRRALVYVCLISAAVLPACGQTTDNAPVPAAPNWASVRDGLIEEYLQAHPAFAVVQGRHEYDGRLPDWSAAAIAAEMRRLHAARDRAAAMDAGLSEAERFERDDLIARFERDLYWLEVAEAPFTNPAWYLDWIVDNLDPAPYLTRDYAPLDVRMRAYTSYARAVPQATARIRANLRTPLARPLLERGVSAFRGFADFYQNDVPGIFASVQDAARQKEFSTANSGAATAMRELAGWLESQRATATGSFALGADRFARMLQMTEGVTTPLADLEAAGRADMARNQQALREACAKHAPGAGIPACIAKMNAVKPKGGVVEGARAQLAVLKTFVQDAGVATIPSDEQANVDEAPPYNRANFAYIDIPGPYEQGLPATYYIAPPDPSWTPAEQRDYLPGQADLLFTSVHEVWPGHFLQFLHSNRNPSLVGRLFVGYAFAEGWAHYAEETMWDMGLGAGDPETHIGQLTNALMRNARFLSAIGLHTKGMTVEASERMFREEAFTDVGTARQQAARGTYDPAYLNYTMGKLMIRKLRDDWTASRGGRQAWRQFHDQFLTYGGPPIPMVRQRMMGIAEGSLF